MMPRLAVEFSAQYPDVALDVHIVDTEETLAALLHHDVEVAIVGREVNDHRLVVTVVGQDELVVVVATNDPLLGAEVGPVDLADRPFALREEGSATRRVVEDTLAAAGVTPRVAMELGSNVAVVGRSRRGRASG